MTFKTKILLSIPSIISITYFLTYFLFPEIFTPLINNIGNYYIVTISINLLVILQLVVLIYLIWKYKPLTKAQKWNWTLFLIILQSLGALIFIWNINSKLTKQQKKKS